MTGTELAVFLKAAADFLEDLAVHIHMASRLSGETAGDGAVDFLTTMFREEREWSSSAVMRAAREAGISRIALFTGAAARLPIKKRKRVGSDGHPYWVWVAEDGWPKGQEAKGGEQ